MLLKLIIILRRIQNKLYSQIIRGSHFKSVGEKFHVEYPFTLIGAENITIGKNFNSYSRFRIEAHSFYHGDSFSPVITIGDNVSINFDCHIGCINKVQIGNNVLIGSKVFITDHSHGNISKTELTLAPVYRQLYSKGPVIIEDNVWIGEAVTIMPNVNLGKNCIVGANSVVTKSFPANSVIAGNPARLIKSFD